MLLAGINVYWMKTQEIDGGKYGLWNEKNQVKKCI